MLTIKSGVIIVAVIAWGVTTFGIQVFHYYERFVSNVNILNYILTSNLLDLHSFRN